MCDADPRFRCQHAPRQWDEAQREHERVCRERLVLIAQRHQELLEILGYYQGLQAAYAHLRRLRPLDGLTQSG